MKIARRHAAIFFHTPAHLAAGKTRLYAVP